MRCLEREPQHYPILQNQQTYSQQSLSKVSQTVWFLTEVITSEYEIDQKEMLPLMIMVF